MGIAGEAYELLLTEKKRGLLQGDSILQLGRQCIQFDERTLRAKAAKRGVQLAPVETELSFNEHYRKMGYIDDKMLFKALGFSDVQSLDNSDFEGSEIIHDLNQPIDQKYWSRFDVIYDGGTAEHVFHFPQLLKNIHLMLKEGGIIIHVSPSHNHVDHGFYMFSPQVYSEYYLANGYEIKTSHIFEYTHKYSKRWKVFSYEPGLIDELSYGGYGKKMLGIHCIAKKMKGATCDRIPQQGTYVRCWNPPEKPVHKRRKVNPIHRLGISWNKKLKRRSLTWKVWQARKKLKEISKT